MSFRPKSSLHPPNENNLNLDLLLEPSSSSNSSSAASYNLEPRIFSCNYCQRKFYSSQALGGHQNAHKLERTLAKRSRELSSAMQSFGLSEHRSSSSSFSGSNHLARVGSPNYQAQAGGVSYERRDFIYGGSKPRSSSPCTSENVQEDIGQLDLSLRL